MIESEDAEAVVARLTEPGGPGGVAGVARGGRTVWSRAFGLANTQSGAPFTPGTRLHICSITKTFTGLLLGLLEAEGVLSMDEPLNAFLPAAAHYPPTLTLRRLVTNTSGLRDYFPLMALEAGGAAAAFGRSDMERHALGQPSLMFPPGARFSYSNSSFVALCRAIEARTGQAYGDLLQARILGPAGLANTVFRTQTVPEPDGAALGHSREQGAWRPLRLDVHEAGDGGVWSTLEDMLAYGSALTAGALGPPGLISRLTTPPVFPDGRPGWYACGFGTGQRGGARWFGHAGGLAGMSTNLACFPDLDAVVFVALNGPLGDAEEASFQLAQALLGLAPDADPPPIAAADLSDWAGWWQDDSAGVTLQLAPEGHRVREWRLGAESLLAFGGPDRLVEHASGSEIRRLSPEMIELRPRGNAALRLTRLEPTPEPPPDGLYRGMEIAADVRIGDGGLAINGGPPALHLEPAAAGVWRVRRGGPVGAAFAALTRTSDGHLILSMAKAERIQLRRQN